MLTVNDVLNVRLKALEFATNCADESTPIEEILNVAVQFEDHVLEGVEVPEELERV